jgi:enoyl-[acyl-carrier protein] reductase II
LSEVVIEERVPVVTTSAGNPATLTSFLKENGIKVLHVVASCRHALGAERAGVDAVIAEGYEAGGHNGMDELTTFVLVPQVVDAVRVPVVAAGGIADARGVVAALALGAEGVQIGTRFIATHECCAHPSFKKAVLETSDTSTVITGRKISPTRGIKNAFTSKLQEMEAAGASARMEKFIVGRSPAGQLRGDVDEGEMLRLHRRAGQGDRGAGDVVRGCDGVDESCAASARWIGRVGLQGVYLVDVVAAVNVSEHRPLLPVQVVEVGVPRRLR